MTTEPTPTPTRRSVSTADAAYAILGLGPVVGVVFSLQSPLFSGDLLNASPGEMTLASVGFLLAGLALVAGGVMAVRSRWHRPLLWLGVYALSLFIFILLSNVIGFFRGAGPAPVPP